MNGPALLDVNVLLALFSPDHVHHETAHDWFADHHQDGWATCPLTQNAFVRIMSNPAAVTRPERPQVLLEGLSKFCRSREHVFWADTVSLADETLFDRTLLVSPHRLTDIYLLGLARKMGGSLATFDRAIPLGAVVGATRATLSVIAPVNSAGVIA